MKLAPRKAVSSIEQRRTRRLSDRVAAPALRTAFPQVENLRIELNFSDRTAHAPSLQQHILYPSARAFFRFACPCFECDGEFDLTGAVNKLVADPAGSKRRANRTATDTLACQGVRLRDRPTSQLCPIQVQFRLVVSGAP
jgi:hypothetical protein